MGMSSIYESNICDADKQANYRKKYSEEQNLVQEAVCVPRCAARRCFSASPAPMHAIEAGRLVYVNGET
jgi:hypothetical protein